MTFDDSVTFYLNGDRLDVVHVSDAHTDGDAVLWWQAANVVHTGDVYFNGSYPFVDLDSGGTPRRARGGDRGDPRPGQRRDAWSSRATDRSRTGASSPTTAT